MTQEERYQKMTTQPVNKLIISLAVPTIISMMVTSVYNLADTFFVSQLGTSASGAVGIVASLMFLIQAIGFTFGSGSGNYISRSLGSKKREEAEITASTAFFTTVCIGLLILILGCTFIWQLVRILGATESIAPYAVIYMRYILYAAPFMMGTFVMNNLLRAQGLSFYAMVGIGSGAVLNIVLDPLFIFKFNMGIHGAAIATMISQIMSFLILFVQCNLKKETISILFRRFKPSLRIYGEILHAGMPSFCRQGCNSVVTIVTNWAAAPYGDAAIAAMSIVSRCVVFINSALLGFGQGYQPVAAFNYGAGRYDRVLKAFKFAFQFATVVLLGMAIVFFAGAEPVIAAFRKDDAEVIRIGAAALRFRMLTLPLHGWIITGDMLGQGIGYGFRSSLTAMSRQGLFLIPIMLILPHWLGITGVVISQPIADVCSIIFCTIIYRGILKELKEKEKRMLQG